MSQQTQWGGRFSGQTDPLVVRFTESISYDKRLYRHDVRASQAHARMLAEVGLLTAEERDQIVAALDEIRVNIERDWFAYSPKLEDVHTHLERALIEKLEAQAGPDESLRRKLGDVGRKLHTGRSRNDQVVTAVKLWVRDALDTTAERLRELQRAFVSLATQYQDVILPGYTHLQRAQPVLAAHYCLAYVEKLDRDVDRLTDCRTRVNVLPLGSAALAGTSLPINRAVVRDLLDFDGIAANSLDVSSDRDFLIEFVFCLSLIAVHLGGWAEEWVLWATTEFAFLHLPDEFCTGSSIMPHKKNPDVLELIRGKTARVIADLNQLLVLVKGLPLAYNRDLQEDKLALFDAFDTVDASLEVAAALVRQTRFEKESIASRLEDGFLDATTLMEHLIGQSVPMRSAHEAVGKLVKLCETRRCRLADLPAEDFDSVRPGLTPGVYKVLGVANALAAFRSDGSTSPERVREQLETWQGRLG